MLDNTYGRNKLHYDDARYDNANFHGNKQTFKAITAFKRSYDKQNLTLVII